MVSDGIATVGSRFAQTHDESVDRRDANRAVAVSAVGLLITGGVELALAIITGSVALLGDALHNLSDVSTSAVVFLGFWVSKRPPSKTYPYGFERAEDLAGLGVALVVWLSAVFAGYESYRKLVGGEGTSHLGIGMAGAALGIIGNQVVARYKAVVGKRIQSVTLQADAKHSWLDALSSLGALIGLIVVASGRTWGDPIAGFAVTLFILHVGWEVTREVVHHLMDGLDAGDIDAARDAACAVSGVEAATVRGRWMGRSLLIEVEGQVAARTTIESATSIGAEVAERVHDAVPAVRDVRFIPAER
ncbi:MAG: cation transporter [Candidatus Dormibacteraeota bacterium]|uniref:Cation transporter n=1 Tax=Candidatus Amunia macphersoniae TaxID=3127014 RepID=A0A934NEW3_9BACT|nr:cation transporter [Candidatus Dormibacteraeota bacterium]